MLAALKAAKHILQRLSFLFGIVSLKVDRVRML